MITRTFKLCLNAGTGSAPFINVSQYDEGETWLFELYTETGERYIPSTGAIVGVKSDGHGIVNTGTVDNEGRVVITETQQMTASAGRAIFELSIDGLTHGTANFIVAVERKPTDEAVMSDSDLSLIQQAVDAAETIEDLIEGHDPDEVIADAVDAWLDAHPEATTTVEDGAITSAKLNDEVKTGVFDEMTVGTSLAVMNDTGTTDNLAYKFRQTGADAVRELDEIVGGTIAWNQLADFSAYRIPSNANGITYTGDGSSVTMNGTASALERRAGWFGIGETYTASRVGHKCLFVPTIISGTASDGVGYYLFGGSIKSFSTPTIQVVGTTPATQRLFTHIPSGAVLTNCKVTFICVDLTAMFGSAVADAIYAMEQSSAGAGVAYFRSLFPNAYYAYNSGELVSVEGLSSHDTVGFNQWDEEIRNGYYTTSGNFTANASYTANKNPIPVIGGATYYFKCDTNFGRVCFYDSNMTNISANVFNSKNTTLTAPANACYMNFDMSSAYGTTYKNDICINFSSSENGTYKPYQKHTYPLDSTLTLRGVPKWSNGLYFDGDIYRHDGSVSRRYGIVDLGTLTWTTRYTGSNNKTLASALPQRYVGYPEASMIAEKYTVGSTNGVGSLATPDEHDIGVYTYRNLSSPVITTIYMVVGKDDTPSGQLVYKVAEPTTETADPYQQYQICDGKGTEEYVSTTVTPVGHSTFYPVDIVAKVNKLPSDFSTLIAPTEATFKATRNYTAKQFLIINNQLYRVTANIANGANIVPNTNVTAVTIADILTTLI